MNRSDMLDLVLTHRERLWGNMKVKESHSCNDHEMVEFKILRSVHSKLTTLDFGRADLELFRDLLCRVLWDEALERREAQES